MAQTIVIRAGNVGFHVDVPGIPDNLQKAFATYEWARDYAVERRRETGFPIRDDGFDHAVLAAFVADKEDADLMIWTSFEGDNIACMSKRGEDFMVNYYKENAPCDLQDDDSRIREPMRLFVLPVGSESDTGQRAIENAAVAGLTICEL